MEYTEQLIREALDRYVDTGVLSLYPPPPVVKEPPAKPVVRDILRIEPSVKPNLKSDKIAAILEIVSKVTGVGVREIKSRHRKYASVRARHIAYYVARSVTPYSLLMLGDIFDRDHATVLHGLNKVENRKKDYEPELSLALNHFSSWVEAA